MARHSTTTDRFS